MSKAAVIDLIAAFFFWHIVISPSIAREFIKFSCSRVNLMVVYWTMNTTYPRCVYWKLKSEAILQAGLKSFLKREKSQIASLHFISAKFILHCSSFSFLENLVHFLKLSQVYTYLQHELPSAP
ncbi:MAG: hypothetical protein DA405_09615 [Bacteroidetes bacterium]|nr:MAG: hypothetical protein DA405_09615 [Bacteroidota bacterium]